MIYIACSHWGLFVYSRAWDGSWPIEERGIPIFEEE